MSAYHIFYLAAAREDYKRELRWSSNNWGESHARRFFDRVQSKISALRKTPRIYPASPDGQYHMINMTGLRAAYHVNDETHTVTILAFVVRNRFNELEGIASRRFRKVFHVPHE